MKHSVEICPHKLKQNRARLKPGGEVLLVLGGETEKQRHYS